MTLGKLKRQPAGAGLCSTVKLENVSDETQNYNSLDFSVQYPSGNITGTQLIYDGDIDSGELAQGGHVAGRVCFVDKKESGQYEVFWDREEVFTDARRGVWIYKIK